ncbi:MAG: hypothetical protein ACTSQI_18040 [Candidatus Helarchaeota archaeon]
MNKEEPPIQYYEVLDYKTITRRGPWWILLALCREPTESNKTFLAFYKYQKRKNSETGDSYWQKKSSFRLNNIKHIPAILEAVKELSEEWENRENEEI